MTGLKIKCKPVAGINPKNFQLNSGRSTKQFSFKCFGSAERTKFGKEMARMIKQNHYPFTTCTKHILASSALTETVTVYKALF